MRRIDCHSRIKEVRSNYETALQAVNVLIGMVIEQSAHPSNYDYSLPTLRSLARELHDVYFARMFACFESSLRHYWRACVRDSRPSTQDLVESIATRRGIPEDTRDTVQEIRQFRNHLIHDEFQAARRFTIDDASRHLNTFLARLPLQW